MQAPIIYPDGTVLHTPNVINAPHINVVASINTDHLEQSEAYCFGGLLFVMIICALMIVKQLKSLDETLKVMSGFQMIAHKENQEAVCSTLPKK